MSDILSALEAAHKEATTDPVQPLHSNVGVSAELLDGTDVLYAADGFEEYLELAVSLINHCPALLDVARKAREITDAYYAPGSRLRIPVNLAEELRAALAALESPTGGRDGK